MSERNGLPPGWAIVNVQDIADAVQPGFPCGQHNADGIGLPHLRPMNIDAQGRLSLEELKYVNVPNAPLLDSGDILFNNTNSPVWVGKTTTIRQGGVYTFSNHMTRIRLNAFAGIPSYFAFQLHYLQQAGYFQVRCRHHVNQASIGAEFLSEQVEIKMAPLAEQHRIVAAIEQQFTRLDAGVAALRRVRAALKRYRAAVLKAAVEGRLTEAWRAAHAGAEPAAALLARILAERRARWETDLRAKGKDPAKARYDEPAAPDTAGLPALPEGWCWATIGQVTDCLDYMRVPVNKSERAGRIGPVPYYGANGQVGWIDTYLFDEPLVLVVEDETFIGRELPFAYKVTGKAWVNNHAHVLRALGGLGLDYLNYSLAYYPFTPLTTGSTGRRKLTQAALVQAPCALPPYSEQVEIVAEVERRLSVVSEVEGAIAANLTRAERLRQSILERAFSGRLVPQDASDEPASALLERIRGEREQAGNGSTRRNGRKGDKGHGDVGVAGDEPVAVAGRQAGLWDGR